MNLTIPNAASLPDRIRAAFDVVLGRANVIFAKEHNNSDGTHASITATKITLAAITAPSRPSAGGTIYVDSADGDLKVIFANGTTKTIETN